MRHLPKLSILIALTVTAFACSTGRRALQQGDYYDAAIKAIERLRGDPANAKAVETLRDAYPLAVADAERRAARAPATRDLRVLEGNISLYQRMNSLAEEILHSPGARKVIPVPKVYEREARETMDLVGELYYEQGMAALAAGTLESARAAYDAFSRTAHYTPGYRDVNVQLEKARLMGTLRVVVTRPLTPSRYEVDAAWFYDQLMAEVTSRTYRNLVRFYTPEEADAERMNDPHQVLVLDFADFTVGNSATSRNTREYSRDSVLMGTTTIGGQKQNVYGTVKAKYTVDRLEIISQGVLTVRILDGNTQRVANQKAFPGRSVWFSEAASFNGDERALSKQQLSVVGRRLQPVPPPQELFRSFAVPLYAQASAYIGTMYSRL
jgi:hypothetical protein